VDNKIETSKSSRSSCRVCKKKIDKDELRFGVAYQSRYDQEGQFSFAWHHMPCAAKAAPEKLKPSLDAYEGELSNRAELEKLIAEAPPKKVKEKRAFPYAEKAPSGRSKCIECGKLIEKATFRFVVEREVDAGAFTAMTSGFLCRPCGPAYIGTIDWEAIKANSKLEDADLGALQAECAAPSTSN